MFWDKAAAGGETKKDYLKSKKNIPCLIRKLIY